MGSGEAWGQDQREGSVGSVGAEGTGETLVKINKKHKNKTLDTKNNEYIKTLEESNAQIYFK